MKIAVFGGTGRTGKLVVQRALAEGHQIRTLVRNPQKMDLVHDHLTVIEGNVSEQSAVTQTITGTQGVISTITPSPEGMENIIQAMQETGLRRLIVSGGAGVYRPGDDPPLSSKIISWLIKTFSNKAFEDSRAVADALPGSSLDWTLVRAPRLVNKPATNNLYSGPLTAEMKTTLSREDYANFLLAALSDDTLIGKTPVVSDR